MKRPELIPPEPAAVTRRLLLRLLPVARPHTGRHQAGSVPPSRVRTALLAGRTEARR